MSAALRGQRILLSATSRANFNPHVKANSCLFPVRTSEISLATLSRPFSTTKAMTSSAPMNEWLVQIPDHPNALDKRLAVRPQHLANLKPKIESGIVVFGGAMLSKQPAAGEAPDMRGSCMLIKANTEQEVRDMLENDAYTKGGAWDPSKAVITPFKCAVRTPM